MPTLQTVLDTYLSFKTLKPNTAAQYRRFVEKQTADWCDIDIQLITRRMCLDRYHQLSHNSSNRAKSNGVGMANATFRVLRALFNFAAVYWENPLLNPVTSVRTVGVWQKMEDRTSYLTLEQLGRWYRLLHRLPSVDRDYFLVLVMTGARASEIADLKWSEVDLISGMLHIPPPRTKGKKWHNQPICRQALTILKERKLLSATSEYVFSTPQNPREPYSENRRAYSRIEIELGTVCNPHTLRRTFATYAKNYLNIDKFIVKRCLNHSSNDITDRYIQQDPEVLREPFQMVADFMFLKMRGEKPRIRLLMQLSS